MELLHSLRLEKTNSGASTGLHWWSSTQELGEIISSNSATGEPIASIYRASTHDYETVINTAQTAFLSWREVPAPKRGEIVRAIGDELRRYKDFLGSLVSLEMGKSKQESHSEMQKIIFFWDFAIAFLFRFTHLQ